MELYMIYGIIICVFIRFMNGIRKSLKYFIIFLRNKNSKSKKENIKRYEKK